MNWEQVQERRPWSNFLSKMHRSMSIKFVSNAAVNSRQLKSTGGKDLSRVVSFLPDEFIHGKLKNCAALMKDCFGFKIGFEFEFGVGANIGTRSMLQFISRTALFLPWSTCPYVLCLGVVMSILSQESLAYLASTLMQSAKWNTALWLWDVSYLIFVHRNVYQVNKEENDSALKKSILTSRPSSPSSSDISTSLDNADRNGTNGREKTRSWRGAVIWWKYYD